MADWGIRGTQDALARAEQRFIELGVTDAEVRTELVDDYVMLLHSILLVIQEPTTASCDQDIAEVATALGIRFEDRSLRSNGARILQCRIESRASAQFWLVMALDVAANPPIWKFGGPQRSGGDGQTLIPLDYFRVGEQ